jgi:AraC-like DNA-binding protein
VTSGDYSPASHEQPLELEATTSEPARTLEPSELVEGLSIADTASAYGLSVSTLRRLLKAGKVEGAVKVPGPKGIEYRIPPGSLEALGYKAKETRAGAVLTAARAGAEAEQLAARVRELEALLQLEAARREIAEEVSRLKDQQIADLRTFTRSLTEALDKLPRALEPSQRRRLFRRK